MSKIIATPVKAIRKKCLDCCCDSINEVRNCQIIRCPIYPYRFGKRPSEATIDTLKRYYGEK
ncbi:MAG: hypothetical protein HQ509_04720 [Candidatus Marinimicrobia bacterium]|nr:hypothetical protein [Candidatus Neomarinimicrobiota bacterium]